MQRSVYSYRAGYTLIEILVATALSLILLGAVVQIFGLIGGSVSDSRATLEASDRLRATAIRLQKDLAGLTVTPIPPRSPESDEGYLEIVEGPVGPTLAISAIATDNDSGGVDTTVGDFDDILMFTTRSADRPFVGKYGTVTIESDTAEVAWFLRGRTHYRRVLLVVPGATMPASTSGFYNDYDISIRNQSNVPVANTLGDLTRRECRFAHHPTTFPYDVRGWGSWGLPTLEDCSVPGATGWNAGGVTPFGNPWAAFDFWNDPTTGPIGVSGPRASEDIILTNVIGFDVKAWDPEAPVMRVHDTSDNTVVVAVPGDPGYIVALKNRGKTVSGIDYAVISYGAYADLNYMCLLGPDPSQPLLPKYTLIAGEDWPHFYHAGNQRSSLRGTPPHENPPPLASQCASIYDTWSSHYEADGNDQDSDGVDDEGTNGFDDDGNGIVDDAAEQETSPPYPVRLRGIQVKIRVFEPDSRQIREVTVVQDFLTK